MYGRGDRHQQRDRQEPRQNERRRRSDNIDRHGNEASRSSRIREERESDYPRNTHDWNENTSRRDQQRHSYGESRIRRNSPERHDNRRGRTSRSSQLDQRHRENDMDIGYQKRMSRHEREYTGLDYSRDRRPENDRASRDRRGQRNSPSRHGKGHDRTLQDERDRRYRQERNDRESRNRRDVEHENRNSRSRMVDDNHLSDNQHSSRDRRYNQTSSRMPSAAAGAHGNGYEELDRHILRNEDDQRNRDETHDLGTHWRMDALELEREERFRLEQSGQRNRLDRRDHELGTNEPIDADELKREEFAWIDSHGRRESPYRHDLSVRNEQQDQGHRADLIDRGQEDRMTGYEDRIIGQEDRMIGQEDRMIEQEDRMIGQEDRMIGHEREYADHQYRTDLRSENERYSSEKRYKQSSVIASSTDAYVESNRDFDRLNLENEREQRRQDRFHVDPIHHDMQRKTELERDDFDRLPSIIIASRTERYIEGNRDLDRLSLENERNLGRDRYPVDSIHHGMKHTAELGTEEFDRIDSNVIAQTAERYVDRNRDFDMLSLENGRDLRRQDGVLVDSMHHGLKCKAGHRMDDFDRKDSPGRRRLDEDIMRDRLPIQYANEEGLEELRKQRLIEEDLHDRRNLPQNERDQMIIDGELGNSQDVELMLFERRVIQAKLALMGEGSAEQLAERTQKGRQERIRDRSPLDSRGQKGQGIERSRDIPRKESDFRRKAPMRQLPSLRSSSQPSVNLRGGLDFIDQGSFDQEVDPVYEQDSDEETNLVEEDFDEGVDPLLVQHPNYFSNPVLSKMLLSSALKQPNAALEGGFNENVDQVFAVDDAEVLQEPFIMDIDNIGGIKEIPNVRFAQSDLLYQLQPNVSKSIVMPHVETISDFADEPLQMDSLSTNPLIGIDQTAINVNSLPVSMSVIPQMSNTVQIANIAPQIVSQNLDGNLLGPKIVGISQHSNIGGNQQTPGLLNNFSGPGTGGMPLRTCTGEMPLTSDMGIMPSTTVTSGMTLTPDIGIMPSTTGTGGLPLTPDMGIMPSTTGTGGLPLRPGMGIMPPTTATSGMPLRPGTGGMPLTPGIGIMPPRPGPGGMPLRPDMMPPRLGIGGMPFRPGPRGMPPRPFFPRMFPRPFFPGMPPRFGRGGMPPMPGFGMMPPRPFFRPPNVGIPNRLAGKTTKSSKSVGSGTGKPSNNNSANEKVFDFRVLMKCPLCPEAETFLMKSKFDFHWKMFHFKMRENILCPEDDCHFSAATTFDMEDHFKMEHKEGSDELSANDRHRLFLATKERVDNPDYIDPRNFVYIHKKEKTYVEFSVGMKCPVCPKLTSFENVEAFTKHWQDCHTRFTKKLRCSSENCGHLDVSIENLRKHYWEKHNYGNDELTLEAMESLNDVKGIIVKNKQYIEPGQFEFDGCKPLEFEFEPGMKCPICHGQPIHSIGKYFSHWESFHVEFHEFLNCPIANCKWNNLKNLLQSHLSKQHNLIHSKCLAIVASAQKEIRSKLQYRNPHNCIFSSVRDNQFQFKVGMQCPCCQNEERYEVESAFYSHWKKHVKRVPKYECPFLFCNSMRTSLKKLKGHISQDHQNLTLKEEKLLETVDSLKAVLVETRHYVDPGPYVYDRDSSKNGENQDGESDSDNDSDDESDSDKDSVDISDIAQEEREEIKFVEGSPCPLCANLKISFFNLQSFKAHWQFYHTKFFYSLKCPAFNCLYETGSVTRLKEHYREHHNDFGDGDETDLMLENLLKERIRNKLYVPPGKYFIDDSVQT